MKYVYFLRGKIYAQNLKLVLFVIIYLFKRTTGFDSARNK